MAVAASGEPTSMLTLSSNVNNAGCKEDKYKALHEAWRNLVKRTIRQFSKKPETRWMLTTPEGYEYQEIRAYRITIKTAPKEVTRLHYMAFAEETKSGEPHLHILLRTEYIPQRWLSQQMKELINSPVLWIEKIKGTSAAIAYVSKYITKAPAKFGKSRRYWVSRFYQVNTPEKYIKDVFSRLTHQIVRQRFSELVTEILHKRLIPRQVSTDTIHLYTLKGWANSAGSVVNIAQDGGLAVASHLLGSWREILRI